MDIMDLQYTPKPMPIKVRDIYNTPIEIPQGWRVVAFKPPLYPDHFLTTASCMLLTMSRANYLADNEPRLIVQRTIKLKCSSF